LTRPCPVAILLGVVAGKRTLLVVDDHVKMAKRAVPRCFTEYQIIVVASGVEAVECAREKPPDGAIVDFFLQHEFGVELGVDVIDSLRREQPRLPAVIWTGAILPLNQQRKLQERGVRSYSKIPDELPLIRDYFDGKPETYALPRLPTSAEHKARYVSTLVAFYGSINEASRREQVDRRTLQRTLRKASRRSRLR
jgi:ActR/RegA family two-component response regulator